MPDAHKYSILAKTLRQTLI